MEPAVRALHTDAVRAGVAELVGVDLEALATLGGFESFVYETTVDEQPRIVKATWHERRTPEQMGAELHFVNYLANGGAPVCRAFPLADGHLIGTVPAARGAFHVCAFEKAPGAILGREERTEDHWIRWGALVGGLHRLSTAYPGPPAPLSRPTWEEEHAALEPFLRDEPVFLERYCETLDAIRGLPRDAGAYGASHTDLHSHNIFWHEGEPRVFDFDDMLDFWFVSDLAIVLYYALLGPVWHEDDRQADFEQLRALLLRGYATEHALPGWSHEALQLFLSLREQTLRAVIQRSIPEADRSAAWQQFFVEATDRIQAGRPPLDLQL